jgi:hypothetical protein
VQLVAHRPSPGDVRRHAIAQVDPSERRVLHRRPRRPGSTKAAPRGRADFWPPRHPPRLMVPPVASGDLAGDRTRRVTWAAVRSGVIALVPPNDHIWSNQGTQTPVGCFARHQIPS